MPATSEYPVQRSTFPEKYGDVGPTGYVRSITRTMLSAWEVVPLGHRKPEGIAGLKSDIQSGRKTPIVHLLRLAFATVDAGVPVQRVVAFLKEMIEAVEHYAQRRERRLAAGVLPFRQVFARLNARAAVEDGEAEAAIYELNENCVESVRAAESQLMESMAADETRLAKLRARRLELEVGR